MPQADGSLLFDSKLDLAGFEVGVNMASDIVSGIGEKLKGLASSVLQTGMDFTASMSEVQALSGATGKELEALTETAKEYGASTQFTASESAQALKYMAGYFELGSLFRHGTGTSQRHRNRLSFRLWHGSRTIRLYGGFAVLCTGKQQHHSRTAFRCLQELCCQYARCRTICRNDNGSACNDGKSGF